MAKVPRSVLKQYFQAGDIPTEAQFGLTLDSMVNFVDDRDFIGLRSYNSLQDYLPGDCAVFNDQVVKCITATTGTFNPAHWTVLAAFGSVVYAGTWDTQNNVPALASSVGTKGFYYVVINASPDPNDNTELNGISDWGTGDWAIYNGSIWEKVDNTEAPVPASNVSFIPTVQITSTNVQDAIEEVYADLDAGINTKVNRAGDTMTGALVLSADPTVALEAATKQYVDAGDASLQTQVNAKVNLSGDTMTGDLILNADPTVALGAVTKQYVDAINAVLSAQVAAKVNRAGDTMTGDLVLNADPTLALGAATKQYVDAGDTSLQTQVNAKVNRAGDTMTGDLILNADPTNVLGATTKQYVDAGLNAKVDVTGDTMLGDLILNADPTVALGAATKQYVDSSDAALQSQVNAKVNRSGDTMTGDLILNADPTAALGAATKQYVDTADATKVNKAGDTMSGALILNADPTAALGASTKQYVDAGDAGLQSQVNAKVNRSGDTMTGDLILNADPTAALGAATKQYVDTADATKVNKAGDTMTGLLTLSGDPTSALNAVTKQYADALDAAQTAVVNTKVSKAGDTMTGLLTLSGDPTSALNAATKQYTDAGDAAKLNLSGGTLSGNLILNADPSAALGAATKQYVDTAVGGVPAQQKVVVIPLTFSTIYSINTGTSTTWSRLPLQVAIPAPGDIFPGTTAISAKIMIDYNTTSGATGLKMALLNYTDYPGGTIDNTMILSGSSSSLSASTSFITVVGSSFSLTDSKGWSVVIQRTGGTISVEAASLVLTCS